RDVLYGASGDAVRWSRAVGAAVDRGLEPKSRVGPEQRARGRADGAGVGEAGVAAVRDVHDALRRITGHEVRDVDEVTRVRLVVRDQERCRLEGVAGVRAR